MARIPYPDHATQSDEVRDTLKRLGSLNVTRMASHSEGAMRAYARFGTYLLRESPVDPVVREVMILRIGQLCGSDYEWHQHVSVARAVGMDEATLAAIADRAFDRLTEPQRIAVALAEEIKRDTAASAETFAAAQALFPPDQLVDLILTAGFYIMTAGFLRSFDVEIEDGEPLGAVMAVKG